MVSLAASNVKKPSAVVRGASSGIGYELAQCAAWPGYDLILAADGPLRTVFENFSAMGSKVEILEADLSNLAMVIRLVGVINDRPVAALMAYVGHGRSVIF